MEEFISQAFPFWEKLTKFEQSKIMARTGLMNRKKGTLSVHSREECTGMELVKSGQIRVFIMSPGGGEITLFRLLPGDVCILSAACMIKNLDIEIHMEFEKDTEVYVVPTGVFKEVSDSNVFVKEYTLELISEKFSDVMWLFNQYVFSNMARRLADALLEHSALDEGDTFKITHDALAKDLGTAREVVTRLLKQFQLDGLVHLSRGMITIVDAAGLRAL